MALAPSSGDINAVEDHRFYELFPDVAEPFSAVAEPRLSDEAEQALALGLRHPPEPIVFRQNSDKQEPGHLVPGGSPALLLLSRRLADTLRNSGCTGWATWPVHVLREDGQPVGDHVGLAVVGRCGPIQPGRGQQLGEGWWRGVFFEESSWDGSDIFRPEGKRAGWPYVSERAREAVLEAKLRGVGFEPLSEVEYFE